jgi:hypothetical protein
MVRSAAPRRLASPLLPWGLADPDLQGEPVAQGLDVATQATQGEGVIAALLDAGDLGLGDADALGQLGLGQARGPAGLHQLQPELLLGRLLLIHGAVLGVGLELLLPPAVAGGPSVTGSRFCSTVILLTSSAPDEAIKSSSGGLDLAAGRLPGLLLEAVHEDDRPTGGEGLDHPIDVGLALLAQLPELALQMSDQGLPRSNVPHPQLLDRPVEAGPGLGIQAPQELADRLVALLIDIKSELSRGE